ncbi:MAG TPA: hypothetical protein VNM14_20380 [Planctomycetota bacterium]|jgi:hypothetical protein|nr:hypothetical protein [Planctomycetota bacterium]
MNLKRVLLLVPLLALGAAPRAPFKLEEVLPESTLLFAETPSAPAFRDALKRTPLAKFFEDEEVRAFAGGVLRSAGELFGPFGAAEGDFAWEKLFDNISGQIAFAMPTLVAGDKKEPDLVITVDCSGHLEAVKKAQELSRKKAEAKTGKKPEIWKAGDLEVTSFELPAGRLHVTLLGETVVFATWKSRIEKLAADVKAGQPKPLAKAASFAKAREKAAAKEVFLYADVAGFVREAKEDLEEPQRKFISALGLDGFTFAAGGLSIADDRVNEHFFLGSSGEKKGLAKFLSLKGPASGFEQAPVDALQYVSFSIELGELYDTLLEMLKAADEFQQQRTLDGVAEFEKEVGFSVKNDLFPAFGPRIWWYSALPADGLIPDGVTGLEIRDAARFDKCLQAVLKRLPAELGELDFKGKKINYFKFSERADFDPGRMFLSTVYFLREGDKVAVSSLLGGFGAANALKRHILRQERPTLATQPSVGRWMNGKTDGASLIVYLDLAHAFTTYYNTLAPLATLFKEMLKGDKGGVDLMKLPLGETIGKYLGQTIHKVSVEPDGLRVDGVSGSGTTLMTAVYASAAAAVLFPAVSRINDENQLSSCRTQSSSVYFAVLNYHEEKKKYPDQAGAGFFKQLKESGSLVEDPACPVSGGAYRGPAKDVNAMADLDVIFCDEPTNHKDGSINILRRNGSMATLKPDDPEYKKALETTKGK